MAKQMIADRSISEVEMETPFLVGQAARKRARFLRGPIPFDQISAASCLDGKCLAILLAIHHQQALTGSDWVSIPRRVLDDLGVDKDAKSRGLRSLASSGLVEVSQRPGASARVRFAPTLNTGKPVRESNDARAARAVQKGSDRYDFKVQKAAFSCNGDADARVKAPGP